MRITTSVSKAKLKRVLFVEVSRVVWYTHSTLGNYLLINFWTHLTWCPEPLMNGLIHKFHLTVRLRMAIKCESVPDMKFGIEILENIVIKLSTIVSDDSVEKSVSVDA